MSKRKLVASAIGRRVSPGEWDRLNRRYEVHQSRSRVVTAANGERVLAYSYTFVCARNSLRGIRKNGYATAPALLSRRARYRKDPVRVLAPGDAMPPPEYRFRRHVRSKYMPHQGAQERARRRTA